MLVSIDFNSVLLGKNISGSLSGTIDFIIYLLIAGKIRDLFLDEPTTK